MGLEVAGMSGRLTAQPHLPVSPCALPPRLYPVVPGNSRVPDKDIRVGDYIIPRNVSRAYGSILLSHPSLSWL